MSNLFCGIDVGTTNLKVLLLDDEGKTAWVKSVPAPHLHDGLGVVTDAKALLSRCEELIIEGWRAVGRGRVIRAISSAGIGEDGICITSDFNPLGHAIQWNDRRGEHFARALAASDDAKDYPTILLDFSSSAGKWAWLQKNKPEEVRGASAWITMTDWPLAYWSRKPFISATLAPRTGCYDVFTRQWLPKFLSFCTAPPMAPMIEAGRVVGTMSSPRLLQSGAVNENTILVAGGHDHPVAASAIRRLSQHARVDSMGTANATYGETDTLQSDHDLAGLYVTLPISGKGTAAVIGMTEFTVTLGKTIRDMAGFYDDMLKCTNPTQITPLAAKTLQNLAEQTKSYWQAMTQAGVPEAPVFATGGWARCPAIIQMRVNVFSSPITVVDEPELVALGAALYAAEAVGAQIEFRAEQNSHTVYPTS